MATPDFGVVYVTNRPVAWPLPRGQGIRQPRTVAWIATTGMAYYAIRHRRIELHKQWMVRANVVTFAFVMIRLFNDVLATSVLAGKDLAITMTWAGWVVPRFATELILQFWQIRTGLRE
ncbi:MAG: hypothetical protein QOF03_1888 [Alphaproteobacteria bacterium]|nr:hypothetical protein [Alphaproteobacteria bacterium]